MWTIVWGGIYRATNFTEDDIDHDVEMWERVWECVYLCGGVNFVWGHLQGH